MPKCKVGDLAIVVSGTSCGTLVEVLEWVGVLDPTTYTDLWRIKLLSSARVAAYYSDGSRKQSSKPAGDISYCSDSVLCPLPADLDEATRETEAPIQMKELTA